jgi:tetratricopeptide (TPR) repeat protein
MQQERFFESQAIQERYTQEEIAEARDDEEKREAIIREWHHLMGEERIKYELGDKYMDGEFIDEIALVSKGHTKEDLGNYEDRTKGGQPMRLQLLAALLRWADELDLDYHRVDLDELEQAIIPDESKAHWWKCHYIESVDVYDDGRIKLTFCFSEEDDDKVSHLIPTLVIDKLKRKLDRDGLLDILWPSLRIRLDETPTIIPPGVAKRPVPEGVLKIFEQEAGDLALRRAGESTEPVVPFMSGTLRIAFGQSPENMMRQGVELWRQGDKDNAIAILERGASLYPNSAPIQALLADANIRVGSLTAAEEAARRATDSDPHNFLGNLSLGIILSRKDEHGKALEHLRIAELGSYSLSVQPIDRQRLHLAIARCLTGLGDHWYAHRRAQLATELARDSDFQADAELKTELGVIDSLVEERLGGLETVEGEWEIQSLELEPVLGSWTLEAPLLLEEAGSAGLLEGILLAGSSAWMDYTFECEFQLINRAAGLFIRADAHATSGLMMQFTPSKLRRHQELYSNYMLQGITEVNLPLPLERQKWYEVRFEVSGDRLRTYLDQQLVDDWTDFSSEYVSGKIGFRLHFRECTLYIGLWTNRI